MEQHLEIIPVNTNNNKNKNKSQNQNQNALVIKKKKKSGPMHILRVAMYVFGFKAKKSGSAQVQAASTLYNVVGSMRALHLQNNQSPPLLLEAAIPSPEVEPIMVPEPKPLTIKTDEMIDQFEVYKPSSPSQMSSSSSSGTSSRYASANDLQELARRYKGTEFDNYDNNDDDNDDDGDEDEEDKYYDDKPGDEMIDSKAEEFIAKFYEQMRLQKEAYNTKIC